MGRVITSEDYVGTKLERLIQPDPAKLLRKSLDDKFEKGVIDQPLYDGAVKELDQLIEKAGGEGSRGGHIIGHTQSGKPVYSGKKAENYHDFNSQDHRDANYVHSDEHRSNSNKAYNNRYGGVISEAKRFESLAAGHNQASKDHTHYAERKDHAEKKFNEHMGLYGKMTDTQKKKYRSQIKTVHDVGMAMAGEKDAASMGRFDAHKKFLQDTK